MKKIYLVQLEWNIEGSPEFEVLAALENIEDAKKCLADTRNKIINEWAKEGDFEIEEDDEELFSYQLNQWDEYYIAKIVSKDIGIPKEESVPKECDITEPNPKNVEVAEWIDDTTFVVIFEKVLSKEFEGGIENMCVEYHTDEKKWVADKQYYDADGEFCDHDTDLDAEEKETYIEIAKEEFMKKTHSWKNMLTSDLFQAVEEDVEVGTILEIAEGYIGETDFREFLLACLDENVE